MFPTPSIFFKKGSDILFGITINQEILTFLATLLGVVISIKTIVSWSNKKFDENNQKILTLIDKKLDKAIYEEHKKSFERWSDERDKILEERISKIENNIDKRLDKIDTTLDKITTHMLNCNLKK